MTAPHPRSADILLTANEITTHEDKLQLIRILVLARPDGIAFLVELVPEVRDGNSLGVLIRVDLLPVIHDEGPALQKKGSDNTQACGEI